jgi:hypothetical protein
VLCCSSLKPFSVPRCNLHLQGLSSYLITLLYVSVFFHSLSSYTRCVFPSPVFFSIPSGSLQRNLQSTLHNHEGAISWYIPRQLFNWSILSLYGPTVAGHYYSTTSMTFSLMITWSPSSVWCAGR